jgi:hypothetical protein
MERQHNALIKALNRTHQHVDISPTIQAIQEGTFSSPIPLETFNRIFLNPVYKLNTDYEGTMAAKKIWEETKEERNASLAIFTSEIWNMFPEERKAHPAIFKYEFDHRVLGGYTQSLFERAVDVLTIRRNSRLALPQEQQTPLDTAFRRYDAIIKFGTVHGFTGYDTPSTFIYRGIGTAKHVTWGILNLARDMAHQQLHSTDPTIFTSILESGYGILLAPLANMNKENAVGLMDSMFTNPSHDTFDTRYFRLTEHYGQWRMALDHGELMGIQTDKGLPFVELEPDTITTRCPAMYAHGETKGIVREYFEWSKSIALHAWYPKE